MTRSSSSAVKTTLASPHVSHRYTRGRGSPLTKTFTTLNIRKKQAHPPNKTPAPKPSDLKKTGKGLKGVESSTCAPPTAIDGKSLAGHSPKEVLLALKNTSLSEEEFIAICAHSPTLLNTTPRDRQHLPPSKKGATYTTCFPFTPPLIRYHQP